MAERWVVGFAVDVDRLLGLVGSGSKELIATIGDCSEVDELLGERGDPISAETAIASILAGDLDEERAYEYKRCVEVLAPLAGERLAGEVDVVMTYYLPNDSHGRWEPVLAALNQSTLAKKWGSSSPFPWTDEVVRADWPIVTLLTVDEVAAAAAELAALDPLAVSTLPDDQLVDADGDRADSTRDELRAGLKTVGTWLDAANAKKRGLVLIMDGSQ